MSLLALAGTNSAAAGGYDIANSLKVESNNSEYFIRTFSSAGTQTTGTISFWIKRTSLGTFQREVDCSNASGNSSGVFFENDQLCLDFGGNGRHSLRSEAKLRDTSAWYHCMAVWDTTQSTNTERTKLYINGNRVTSFSTATYPLQNATSQFFTPNDGAGSGNNCLFSRHNPSNLGEHTPNGYHAEFHYIDGTAKTPSDFGKFDSATGIWIPIEYTGSHGSNGFYLNFEDAANLGDDESGNGNDWTETNITSADQATDTPTNNFCTLNPLWTFANTMGVSDGGTKVNNTFIAWGGAKGSIGVNSGKWYWEHGSFSGNDTMFGIQNQAGGGNTQAYLDPYTLAIQANSNVIQFTDPSNRTESFSKTFSVTDIWGVALDLDANTIAYYRNGSIVNSAFSIDGLIGNGEFFPFVAHYGNGTTSFVNFGGYTANSISSAASDENGYGTFEYAPPSGYYALCTKNLAEYG